MKYLNILCTISELHFLFPDATLLDINKTNIEQRVLKIKSQENLININHYWDNNFYLKIQNTKDLINIDSLYVNPTYDLTIVCDRKLWYEFYFPLLRNNPEAFSELESRYVKQNVTVYFNFAILEAVNYEDEKDYFLKDFKFNCIKTSDYELFKNEKNFYYDSFYSLFHILSEGQLTPIFFPNNDYEESYINFIDVFKNFYINNKINKQNLYSHFCLKPRYHRIKFLLEADKNNLLQFGLNNVNSQFIDEYKQFTDFDVKNTDNTKRHTENHKKYFTKEYYDKFLNIKDKINVTKQDTDVLYNHLRVYFKNQEYNESYIEISGETHCIFDLNYGFFTEKSIKPILAEKFFVSYGTNKMYEEYKRIGINMFVDELGFNGIEDKNVLEQIDIIISGLKKLNKQKIKKLYIEHFSQIQQNKKILIDYYCSIMNKINILLLKTKTI